MWRCRACLRLLRHAALRLFLLVAICYCAEVKPSKLPSCEVTLGHEVELGQEVDIDIWDMLQPVWIVHAAHRLTGYSEEIWAR